MKEDPKRFVLWAIAALDLRMTRTGDVCTVELPEGDREAFSGQSTVRLALDPQVALDPRDSPAAPIHPLKPDSPLVHWLCSRLYERMQAGAGRALHARPICQPQSIHELAEPLFAAYTVDGGSVQLGGCTLEDRPLVRLTRCRSHHADGEPFCHLFLGPAGEALGQATIASLHLDELSPYDDVLRRVPRSQIDRLVADATQAAAATLECNGEDGIEADWLLATVIWCKYAAGKLRFSLAGQTEELPFEGWAQTLEAPPFVCPHTGGQGYHLTATDDGRVTLADQIGRCELSGRRVLRNELVRCEPNGRLVLEELAAICPVTGRPVEKASMVPCAHCQQPVAPASRCDEVCLACRDLRPVTKEDARLGRLLGEYPALDPWRSWSIAETGRVYITEVRGLWNCQLMVFDKESLDPLYLARRLRMGKTWWPCDRTDYDRWLGRT